VRSLLEERTMVKLLCHGYVDPDEQDVAWMIANAGALPPGVAAASPEARPHRFSWRDCQDLRSSPPMVFSAACSSAHSHATPTGERLGLFSALRRSGTRCLVGPRWDIAPDVVLPILDEVLHDILTTSCSSADAVHRACVRAQQTYPRWISWALSVEGNWRTSI
jgi:hypothetical protein